jgi:hypothetical protein
MHTSPYVVPTYRAITIVSTVLSRDAEGEMVHTLTTDTTLPDQVVVVYELR